MLPPPDPLILANSPNFANLYNHLTTHVLTPEGQTLANVSEHDTTSKQLNEARATALQDEILLCALEEIVLTHANSTQEDNTTRPSQLPRRPGAFSNPPTQQPSITRANSQLNLPPDLRDLVFNMTAYLSTCLNTDPAHPLLTDTEDLLTEDLAAFQSALSTVGPLLSTHVINTERTLSSLLAPTASQQDSSLPAATTPSKPFRRKPPSQPPLSTLLEDLSSATTHLQRTTLPSTLTTTLSTLLKQLQSHQSQTLSTIRRLELQTHGTHSRHLTSRSTYLATVARGISLKTRLLSLERERDIYSDEESIERMEGELERLVVEERRLQGREEELLGLLGEYEGEGAKVGDGKGSGEQVFQVLGARYREVEGEIEVVKRDIERLETRVWRGR